jgi:NADH-quinone oxidoreductase subunit A
MNALVLTLLVFLGIGIGFLAINLLTGWLVRPSTPTPEKGQVYDCGEEAIGSAWIQFDLRFYVVALLFVIFDVEMAFLFPWAVVFGNATRAGDATLPPAEREAAARVLQPTGEISEAGMNAFARFAFLELAIFFGILLLGFAYLWYRGDLEWIKSVAGQVKDKPVENAKTGV